MLTPMPQAVSGITEASGATDLGLVRSVPGAVLLPAGFILHITYQPRNPGLGGGRRSDGPADSVKLNSFDAKLTGTI
jgi:hypothetical protein